MAGKTRATDLALLARKRDMGIILILLVPPLLATLPTVNALTREGSLIMNAGEDLARSAVIDSARGFAYFGTGTYPGRIVKVRLSDFTRVGALTLNSGESNLLSGVIDAANGFAYFGTYTEPGMVVKIRLSDFTRVAALILNPGENNLRSGVIDSTNGFAYFGTDTMPGIVVKVGLSDFTRVGTITLNAGENFLLSAVADAANGFAYFGTDTKPGIVVKVGLSDLTRVGALTLNLASSEDYLWSAVIDMADGFAYFGTNMVPGGVVKVRLNQPPTLTYIGPKTIDEEATLTFTAIATDPDAGDTLTFSLDPVAPLGASITATGVFTWTPTEAQGPGTYSARVTVSDGSLSAFQDFSITVNEVNVAPVVSVPGPQSAAAGTTLTFTITATDPDVPANTITLSGTGLVTGMTFTPATGQFFFTPNTAQQGMTFSVSFTATDNFGDSDTKTVSITVAIDNPPVLAAIDPKTVNELALLTFTATATDPDPGQTLAFSLSLGAPAGASITTAGVFTWTPTEPQGPLTLTVRVIVNDNLGGSDFEDFTVTVLEVNEAPVLSSIGAMTVNEEDLLTFTVAATDADIPANTLTFSLGAGAPAGAAITAAGVFTWTPTEAQGPGTYVLRVTVTDNLGGSDFEYVTFTVNEVNKPPVLTSPGNRYVDVGLLLTFAVTATDPDFPQNTLTFSLGPGAPSGASITNAGIFSWRPSTTQTGTHSITILVSDATATRTGTITVTVAFPKVSSVSAPWWQQYWYLLLIGVVGLSLSAVLAAMKHRGNSEAQSA